MIGIRGNRTALQYKRLSSVMNRVADSHPEKQGSKPSPSFFFFFFFFFFLMGQFNESVTPPIYCIVTVKECIAEEF